MGFKRVLIATDGSEHTDNAVDRALDIVELSGSDVIAVYVVDTSAFAAIPPDATYEKIYELLRGEGVDAVERIRSRAAGRGLDVDVEELIVEGHPAEKIVDVAREREVDLIVVGTLGKSGIDKFLLGSTAERVVKIAEVPVMVVKGKT